MLKRCLILLFIILQPLRGFADAQAAFCDFANPTSATQHMAAMDAPRAHSADHGDCARTMKAHTHDDTQGGHGGAHAKTCASCCQACGPALTATLIGGALPSPVAPEIHRTERTPASPIEHHIRPPIA